MQILVIGSLSNLEELRQKFGSSHIYLLAGQESEIMMNLKDVEVVFDFTPSENTISNYSEFRNPVFLNNCFMTLSGLVHQADVHQCDLFFGFCGLPTFVNRSTFEVTLSAEQNEESLKQICSRLDTDFVCVADHVGLVTPRVICMIINEAYYTLEEGTANREDIDLAMKLGTNYPFGPFEWARRIGIDQVIKLLDALYIDTKDERYKACDLLRSEINN